MCDLWYFFISLFLVAVKVIWLQAKKGLGNKIYFHGSEHFGDPAHALPRYGPPNGLPEINYFKLSHVRFRFPIQVEFHFWPFPFNMGTPPSWWAHSPFHDERTPPSMMSCCVLQRRAFKNSFESQLYLIDCTLQIAYTWIPTLNPRQYQFKPQEFLEISV